MTEIVFGKNYRYSYVRTRRWLEIKTPNVLLYSFA